MHLTTFLPLLLLPVTSALPSRTTHCRCALSPATTTEEPTPSPPAYTDSLSNPDTLLDAPPPTADLCAALGPSLEHLREANPALYASYLDRTPASREKEVAREGVKGDRVSSAQQPLSTTILLRLGAQPQAEQTQWGTQLRNLGVVLPSAPAPAEGLASGRIVCAAARGERDEAWASEQVSWVTLVVLQVIVALVVVACVAEGVMFGVRWISARAENTLLALPAHVSLGRPAGLRLTGDEKLLCAVPAYTRDDMRSPGVEKKLRAYASPGWKSHRNAAYIEDEDDEFNRPVM